MQMLAQRVSNLERTCTRLGQSFSQLSEMVRSGSNQEEDGEVNNESTSKEKDDAFDRKHLSMVAKNAADARQAIRELASEIFTADELLNCSVKGRGYRIQKGKEVGRSGLPPYKLEILYKFVRKYRPNENTKTPMINSVLHAFMKNRIHSNRKKKAQQ